jgi:hypothetical protein
MEVARVKMKQGCGCWWLRSKGLYLACHQHVHVSVQHQSHGATQLVGRDGCDTPQGGPTGFLAPKSTPQALGADLDPMVGQAQGGSHRGLHLGDALGGGQDPNARPALVGHTHARVALEVEVLLAPRAELPINHLRRECACVWGRGGGAGAARFGGARRRYVFGLEQSTVRARVHVEKVGVGKEGDNQTKGAFPPTCTPSPAQAASKSPSTIPLLNGKKRSAAMQSSTVKHGAGPTVSYVTRTSLAAAQATLRYKKHNVTPWLAMERGKREWRPRGSVCVCVCQRIVP